MPRESIGHDRRTTEQRREHYVIEQELANRLRGSSRQERRSLYTALYDELYERVPLHPLLTRPASVEETELAVSAQMKLIKTFLGQDITFLEIGAGDCGLSKEVAKFVRHVYGVEISETIANSLEMPPNFQFVLSDGSSIPVPPRSVQVAYSNQVMEHLHPDDALEQLRNIHNALAPGGIYICITPNRLNGPHDVSGYFDEVATGFHLKEYMTLELSRLFKEVGFSRIRAGSEIRGTRISMPVFPIALSERLMDKLPRRWGRSVAGLPLIRKLLGVQLIGTK